MAGSGPPSTRSESPSSGIAARAGELRQGATDLPVPPDTQAEGECPTCAKQGSHLPRHLHRPQSVPPDTRREDWKVAANWQKTAEEAESALAASRDREGRLEEALKGLNWNAECRLCQPCANRVKTALSALSDPATKGDDDE
jgi:hypothetical protein